MRYYYVDSSNRPVGPYTAEQLAGFLAQGIIDQNTMIAPEGGAEWKPYSQVFAQGAYPQPHYGGPAARGDLYAAPYSTGAGQGQPLPPGYVPNNLVWAILSTLFCCLPFGIVSIVKACEVNNKLAFGDIQGAQRSSAEAAKWAWVAFWVSLGCVIAYFLFILLVVGVGTSRFR